ncbi:hypothetical protein HAX54_038563 [Datura stramonium]|uniref:Uncharacterized protein n=1 Tax=Datura stramonium TaxID=4076 RepID=A0ABS8SIB1_DATST|nr:hypothetical protein [Datura stramonium]
MFDELFRRCTRISILALLAISVFTPVFLLSFDSKTLTLMHLETLLKTYPFLWILVLLNFICFILLLLKHRIDVQANSAIQQEEVEALKGPHLIVYRDGDHSSSVSSDENR